MTNGQLPRRARAGFLAVLLIGCAFADASQAASASATYTYDGVGRVAAAAYDDGTCVAYSYDASGNRTAQTNTTSGAAGTSTWGAGTWGCFAWSAAVGASASSTQTPAAEPTPALAAQPASALLAERQPNLRSGA